jgi:hypothetical protein
MQQPTFKMVAAGDGSPPTPTGYCVYLLAHAVATVLLLITLVAAVSQFMDWVATPSCAEVTSLSSVSPSTAAAVAGTAPTPSQPSVTPTPSLRLAARAEALADPGDCPCPKNGK